MSLNPSPLTTLTPSRTPTPLLERNVLYGRPHSAYVSLYRWTNLKVLVVTLLYSSLRVLYNENKHKGMKIKKLVAFLKYYYVNSLGQCTSATSAPSDFPLSYSIGLTTIGSGGST